MKKTETKAEKKIFEFKHENGDVFTYDDAKHEYRLNGIELPGTTTPLTLVNELSWDEKGTMSDKMSIIKNWAIKLVAEEVITKGKELIKLQDNGEYVLTAKDFEEMVLEAKKKPNQHFKSAGISGTEIHAQCEGIIKQAIVMDNGSLKGFESSTPQVQNFINWAKKNNVKFLYSEEPIYSKEWMNCGTVDFVCEIDGKILVGDIKTNGDKRRFDWKTGEPVSDIHIPALWQTGCYGKMMTESDARKLIDKFDGVVVVNIKKSGEFDEKLDVRYDYNVESLIGAYDCVIRLYKYFRNKI